jgi:pimeloyl-ACP methyl ester carboxylesterase
MAKKPNIVLVHGAWGDGSHWKEVIPILIAKGYTVRAVQNPLTSLKDDVEKTKSLVAGLEGPTLLVGHSYGGYVIGEAGNDPNVVGLVYVAAWAPDEGETLQGLFEQRAAPPGAAIIKPDAQGFLWLDYEKYHEDFCQDVPDADALVMAVAQKPWAGSIFGAVAGKPAWKTKPTWYQVSTNDRMIPPETEEFFAERMKPKKILRLKTGHASMASKGKEIAAFILEAAESFKPVKEFA